MRKAAFILGVISLGLLFGTRAGAQCSVQAFPSDTVTFTCGQELEIQLSAFGFSGNFAIDNDFNDGTLGSGWVGTPSVTFTNPCGPGPDGTIHVWMGDATPQPRTLTTESFDLSTGANICYEMRYAVQAEPAPCEGPDEPHEGVYLQYSIDNGVTWVTIAYEDPLGGYDPVLTTWQQYCHALPVAAQTANTRIRWHQDATSGAEYDHWGLDNVFISINDPSYSFTWDHNGFVGAEPPLVYVSSDSVFTVSYSNGIDDTCTASAVFQTVPPVFTVSTVPDTSICGNGCISLDATAEILVRPESQPSFINNAFQPIAPLGQPTVIPVAVGNMPVNPVEAGTIESVCLNVNNPALPFPVDVSTFTVTLECPEGTSITLIAAGSVSGTSLANMCFSDNGTPLSSASPPYSGTFQPSSGSMNDFIGCSTDGVWRMTITNSAFLAFGFFNSWEITFNVPEISYTGVFEWSPTTGLDNPSSLNPLACPQNTTTYELMVTDSFNCATVTHEVTIGIIDPSELSVTATITDTPCGAEEGEIELTVIGSSGNETVTWDNGASGTFISGLAMGQYTVTVEDGCVIDSMFTVGVTGGPQIDTVLVTGPQPEEADGELTIIASGGTPPLEFSLDGMVFQTDSLFTGLMEGTYLLTVQDAFGCPDTLTFVLEPGTVIIPNAISPTSTLTDNRTFVIKGMVAPEIQIYSRWGRKVYESPAYQNDWDGDNLSQGVYFYTVKDKSDGQAYTGFVQLMK